MIQRGNNADRHLCQKCRYKAKGAGCDYFCKTDKVRPCDAEYCFLLCLIDERRDTCDISLNCRWIMYADSNMLQYTWYNRFVSYIRTLNAAEFEEVKETVADTLGIGRIETVKVEKVVETVEVEKEPEKVQNEDYSGCVLKLERAEAQLEIYKDLYRELLEKVTA